MQSLSNIWTGVLISIMSALVLASDLAIPTTTAAAALPINARGQDGKCAPGQIECGTLCCPGGNTCTVDLAAIFVCCPDNTFCKNGVVPPTTTIGVFVPTTNHPINAGGKLSPPRLFSWLALFLGYLFIAQASSDHSDYTAIVPSTLENTDAATSGCKDGSYLVQAWQECCTKDTVARHSSDRQHRCCPRSLQDQPQDVIQAKCPPAVAKVNPEPLDRLTETSGAVRLLSNLPSMMWKLPEVRPTNKAPIAIERKQIIGPGCGGFDKHCGENAASSLRSNPLRPIMGTLRWLRVLPVRRRRN